MASCITPYLCIQMIHMIRVLARIPPCDAHLAGGQVDDHRIDGALTIHWVDAFDVVITTDRVWQVNVGLLNSL